MPDIEKQIAEWRRQMLAAGIKSPVPLEELESHLREEIERQVKSGLSEAEAFKNAAHRMGEAAELKTEFAKNGWIKEARRWQWVAIAYSLFAIWISLLPLYKLVTVAKLSAAFSLTDRILIFAALAASLFSVMGWRYGHRFLPVIRNQGIRTAVGVVSCFSGVAAMLFIWLFVFPLLGHMRAQTFFILITWAWAAMAILGGVGYGLATAVRQRIVTAAA